jgi:hypothetical protein
LFPGKLDGGFHSVGQDNEIGRPVIVMAPKRHGVYLSHSGRDIAKKRRQSKGGLSRFSNLAYFDLLLQSPHGGGDPDKLNKDYLPDENSSIKLSREMPQPSPEPVPLLILLERSVSLSRVDVAQVRHSLAQADERGSVTS